MFAARYFQSRYLDARYWHAAGVAATPAVSRGGRGVQERRRARRFARHWRGKFAGVFTNEEFTEWLLAYLAVEQPDAPVAVPIAEKIEPETAEDAGIVEVPPLPIILPATTTLAAELIELEVSILERLIAQRKVEAIRNAALVAMEAKRKREEEEEIAVLLLAA